MQAMLPLCAGSYEFSWIEAQRMLVAFETGFAEHTAQPDEDGLGDAVREAQAFLVRLGVCATRSCVSAMRFYQGKFVFEM